MTTNDLLLIQTLYEYKNISRTAEVLYLAQPTVSKRLRLIEEELGVPLAVRSKHGVTFTPEGEYLAVKAAQINELLNDVRQHLDMLRQEPVQTLTIGASAALIHTYFLDILEDFRRLCPKVEIELVNEQSSQLVKLLEQGKLDFCFVTGDPAFSGEKIRLRHDMGFIGSALPLNLDRLYEYPYLDYGIDKGSQIIIANWWAEHYSRPFPAGLHVSSSHVARDLALRGLGYSFFFLPDIMEGRESFIYPLKNPDGSPVIRNNWCMFHEDRLAGRQEAQKLLAFLRSRQLPL